MQMACFEAGEAFAQGTYHVRGLLGVDAFVVGVWIYPVVDLGRIQGPDQGQVSAFGP